MNPTTRSPKRSGLLAVLSLIILALACFAVAGCGDDDATSSEPTNTEAPADTTGDPSPPASTNSGGKGESGGKGGKAAAPVAISADPSGAIAFETTELTASAGSASFEFTNDSATPHDFQIEAEDGSAVGGTDIISGDSTDVTVDLEAGTYTFFCSVADHRSEGMEGTITVK